MGRLFGTDGIRGEANHPPMDPATVTRAAAAAAAVLREASRGKRLTPAVVVGRDTRLSGSMLEAAAAAGFASGGLDVLLAGVIPTPGVSALVRDGRYVAGAVISASHNPFGDNGLKLFGPDGGKLPDRVEERVESLMADGASRPAVPARKVGVVRPFPEGAERYRKLVLASAGRLRLCGLRVVVDCANGAASDFAPAVLRALGATVLVINDRPDGVNINLKCGSLHPEVVRAEVRRARADLGVTHDGDADRALFVDERGGFVDGDHVLAMCAKHLYGRRGGGLPGGCVVSTVMANLGLELALRRMGVELVRAAVGDRWVKEAMDERGAVLGGEQSGHLIFAEAGPTGDGLVTALRVLKVMVKSGLRLSEAASLVEKCPQVLVNVPVRSKPPLGDLPAVREAVAAAEAELAGEGRVLLRYSGTEHLARVMVEGRSKRLIEAAAADIAAAVREAIGAAGAGRSS